MKCSLLVLSCYLDDELEARRRGELEAHLVACQRCRGGLANLREEMERVGGLARVRVPDHSARAMLEAVGLIGPGDDLPGRSATAVAERPGDVPPWLAGEAGPALPWSAVRPVPIRPAPPPPPPAAEEPPQRFSGVPAVPFDVAALTELAASATVIVDLPVVPPAWAPAGPGAFEAADPAPSGPGPAGHQIDIEEAIADAGPPSQAFPAALDAWISAQPAGIPAATTPLPAEPEPAAAGADLAPAVTPEPAPSAPEVGLTAALTAPDPPPDPVGHHAITGPLGRRRLFSAIGPPHRSRPAADGAAGDPPEPPATQHDVTEPPAPPPHTVAADVPPPTEPGVPAVALTTPDSQMPSPPSYPMTDEDELAQPLPVERFSGGPLVAPRAGLLARVRDHLAMRRALARPVDDLGDGVEIVSGTGAPSRGARLSRADLARRRSEALRPSGLAPGMEMPPPDAITGPAADPVGEITGRSTGTPPRREPSLYQQLPPPARPSALHPGEAIPGLGREQLPATPSPAGGEPEAGGGGGLSWRSPAPTGPAPAPARQPAAWMPPAVEPVPSRHPSPWRPREEQEIAAAVSPPPAVPAAPPSPSQAREGRRLLALFGAAAVVMFAVGLASAHSSSPAPLATPPAPSSPAGGGQASASNPATAPAVAPPATQGQPATQGEPGPAGTVQLNDQHTLGDGGTGYQISQIRYGDHHSFLRAVFSLTPNGAASGRPKVTVGFTDPTTLLVALFGVAPAGGPGSLPNTKVVTGVSLLQPSPIPGATVYQLKLAHPATVTPLYAGSSPLLLVVDIPS